MKKLVLISLLLIVAACAAVFSYSSGQDDRPPSPAPGFGAISGVVLDEDGEPVQDAKVYASLMGHPSTSRMRYVMTDSRGKFFIDRVTPGMNMVHAFNEESGYPDTYFSFYATDMRATPQVTVNEQEVADVVVQLGPKAAKLTIQVSDADTGSHLDDAAIELRRADDPSAYVSVSCVHSKITGTCDVLVPAEPFNIKVSRSGYERQDVTSKLGQQPNFVRLKAGEKRQMDIRLRRVKTVKP